MAQCSVNLIHIEAGNTLEALLLSELAQHPASASHAELKSLACAKGHRNRGITLQTSFCQHFQDLCSTFHTSVIDSAYAFVDVFHAAAVELLATDSPPGLLTISAVLARPTRTYNGRGVSAFCTGGNRRCCPVVTGDLCNKYMTACSIDPQLQTLQGYIDHGLLMGS